MPHGGTDLEATFRAIDRVLEASTISQKEVVFLTDLQAASWRRGGDDDGLKRVLAKLEAYRPRSVVIDLGKSGGENRAVTELRLRDPIITVDHSTIIRAVVHNYGPNRVEGLRVRLMIDGRLGPEHPPINLEVGEDQPAVFNYTFTAPGEHDLRSSGRGGILASEVVALALRESTEPAASRRDGVRWGGRLLKPRARVAA